VSDLADAVQARYVGQALAEATRPRDSSASTVNTTRLEQACTSIQRFFPLYAQQDYDSTDDLHVEIAVEGVVALLAKWNGRKGSDGSGGSRFDAWVETMRQLANTTVRGHEPPVTSSEITRTEETDGQSSPVRPAFDRSKVSRYTPRRQGGVDGYLRDY
jgi:hypothetical protein